MTDRHLRSIDPRPHVHLPADPLEDQVTGNLHNLMRERPVVAWRSTHDIENVLRDSAALRGNVQRTKTASAVLNCRPCRPSEPDSEGEAALALPTEACADEPIHGGRQTYTVKEGHEPE